MQTCPWCGTNYSTFRSTCQNCGGPLPLPTEKVSLESDDHLPSPPLPPRPIPSTYAWRLLSRDGGAITALVFIVLGLVFTFVGGVLTIALGLAFSTHQGASSVAKATGLVGIPFLVIGPLFLITGGLLGTWRYRQVRQAVLVLREGQATEGQILEVAENYTVRVNYRHPWNIRYQFRVDGHSFEGSVTTLNTPGPTLQPGKRACVLYLTNAPEHNVLYPHP